MVVFVSGFWGTELLAGPALGA